MLGSIPNLTLNTALVTCDFTNARINNYTSSTLATTINLFHADGTGNALPVAAVNQILADLVVNLASRPAVGACNLSGGSNAAPTGQGIIDKAAIAAHGWTVTTN